MAKKAKTLRDLHEDKAAATQPMFDRTETDGMNAQKREKLHRYFDRIRNIEGDIQTLSHDKSEVYAEAANDGFDKSSMKEAIRLAKMDPDERENARALVDLYLDALSTPASAIAAE